jgi:hypothetical protein
MPCLWMPGTGCTLFLPDSVFSHRPLRLFLFGLETPKVASRDSNTKDPIVSAYQWIRPLHFDS